MDGSVDKCNVHRLVTKLHARRGQTPGERYEHMRVGYCRGQQGETFRGDRDGKSITTLIPEVFWFSSCLNVLELIGVQVRPPSLLLTAEGI